MRKIDFSPDHLKKHSARLPQEARRWIVPLARFGFAAQGVVYIIIGSLAALAAFCHGGRTTGSHGALVEILLQPYGQIMLGVIAFGFLGYTLWRLTQAIEDPRRAFCLGVQWLPEYSISVGDDRIFDDFVAAAR